MATKKGEIRCFESRRVSRLEEPNAPSRETGCRRHPVERTSKRSGSLINWQGKKHDHSSAITMPDMDVPMPAETRGRETARLQGSKSRFSGTGAMLQEGAMRAYLYTPISSFLESSGPSHPDEQRALPYQALFPDQRSLFPTRNGGHPFLLQLYPASFLADGPFDLPGR